MNNKRLSYIDALKGFGIICITLGHLNSDIFVNRYLYSFHVPLFFFISGYLFSGVKNPIGTYLRKKTMRLLVPFLAWNLLSCTTALIKGTAFNLTLNRFLTIRGDLCWNSPIWFLLVLFMADVLYYLLCHISDKLYFKFIVFAVSCTVFILIGKFMLTAKLNLVPYALMFYSLGNIVRDLEKIEKLHLKLAPKIITLAVLGILGCVFGTVFNIRVIYTMSRFGNITFCLLSAVMSVLFYYFLFKNLKIIEKAKLLPYLGANSMIIMLTQYWVLWGLNALSLLIFKLPVTDSPFISSLLMTALTIAIICSLSKVFKLLADKYKTMNVVCEILGIK